jgi:hypothetical protein
MNIQFGHKPQIQKPVQQQVAQQYFEGMAGKPILKPLPVTLADSFVTSQPKPQFGASCCG